MPSTTADTIETGVPKRPDHLPWAHWHWLVVFALGFVWNWAPRYAYSTGADRRLEAQVDAIEHAARGAGEPLAQRELLARANARHWGPTVARRALRRAVADRKVERRGDLYALPR